MENLPFRNFKSLKLLTFLNRQFARFARPSPTAVQLVGVHCGHKLAQGPVIAGSGAGHAPQVVGQVEIRIIHPHGVIQGQGRWCVFPAKLRNQMQSILKILEVLFIRPALGIRRGIKNRHLEGVE
jgi:hypothetical protein